MKKLLTILGSIGLVATTGVTVVACGSSNKTVDLETVLTVTDLGTINDNSSTTILTAIKSKNVDVKIEELIVSNQSNTQATITVKSDSKVYNEANIIVTYSATLINLETIILTTNLGVIVDNEDTTIEDKIVEYNNSVNKDEIMIVESSKTTTEATIVPIANSTVYTGTIKVTFVLEADASLTDLTQIFININLGSLDIADETTILNKAISLNPESTNIVVEDLEVININATNGTATIKAKSNSTNYTGEVGVEFTVRISLQDVINTLTIVVTQVQMNAMFNGQNPNDEIKAIIANESGNENLNTNEINVTGSLSATRAGSVNVSVIEGSDIYLANSTVDVKFLIDLNSVITNDTIEITAEAIVTDVETLTVELLNQLESLNQNLQRDAIEIITDLNEILDDITNIILEGSFSFTIQSIENINIYAPTTKTITVNLISGSNN